MIDKSKLKLKCESCSQSVTCKILNPSKCNGFSYSVNSNFLSNLKIENNLEENYSLISS